MYPNWLPQNACRFHLKFRRSNYRGFASPTNHFVGFRKFYQNVRKPFCRHRAIQSELGTGFLRIGKLRSRSFRCMWLHPAIRNIASRNRKTFSWPEKILFEAAFLKVRFLLRFKHFSGPGKLLKQSLQRCSFTCASRASWKLILDALKS